MHLELFGALAMGWVSFSSKRHFNCHLARPTGDVEPPFAGFVMEAGLLSNLV
jgi:hypothetical protein